MNDISVDELRLRKAAQYERHFRALELQLTEKGYTLAVAALHYSRDYHQGLRKDGSTPKHMHQVRVAESMFDQRVHFIQAGIDPDIAIAIGLCHDIPEENRKLLWQTMAEELHAKMPHDVGFEPVMVDRIYRVVEGAFALSKYRCDVRMSNEEYFESLLGDPTWMLVKLFDRYDNVCTMDELTPQKLADYTVSTPLLLSVAENMYTLHPPMNSLTGICMRGIRDQMDTHLRLVSKNSYDADGSRAVIAALEQAGKLERPVQGAPVTGTPVAAAAAT